MRKTLEELYYGNLRPSEQRITVGSELQRAVDTITRREEQLEALLDEAGQKILLEMSAAQQTVDHITALENFILGFRLGARIMLECMDSGDGDTKEMIEHG